MSDRPFSRLGPIFLAALMSSSAATTLTAQDDQSSVLDSVAPRHQVEVLPHRIVLDPQSRTTTLTLTNRGDKLTTADLHVVFAYSVWPHGLPYDTTLFSARWQSLVPHDTVVLDPPASDASAASWISGVPAHITLKPHETQRITLRLTPPANVRIREYWARVVVEVNPQRKSQNPGKPKDTRTIYRLPVRGITPQPLRDSTIVFYRPGPVTMGIAINGPIAAALDANKDYEYPPVGCPCRRVWYRIPIHLTGNAPYQGTLHVQYADANGNIFYTQDWELTLYHDVILHGWSEWHPQFPAGKYTFIATFDNTHSELAPAQRLPMSPVTKSLPFEAAQ